MPEPSAKHLTDVLGATYGSWEDMDLVRSVYGVDALRAVLSDAPPGVFDRRSWSYWRARFGIAPVPPLPRRRL